MGFLLVKMFFKNPIQFGKQRMKKSQRTERNLEDVMGEKVCTKGMFTEQNQQEVHFSWVSINVRYINNVEIDFTFQMALMYSVYTMLKLCLHFR